MHFTIRRLRRKGRCRSIKSGTKAAAHSPGSARRAVARRTPAPECEAVGKPVRNFDQIFASRLADADEFYERITPDSLNEDERRVHRQALAGMLWSKQYYYFDLDSGLRNITPIL